jgi:hypothetical protein
MPDARDRRGMALISCPIGCFPLRDRLRLGRDRHCAAVRLDSEEQEWHAYHRCVADTVGRFAGFVAKYMGDGVLIYFGYPEAHEDDAERAVRSGLAVIEAVGKLATPEPLRVRLGTASGLVVVGDLIGAGAAQERVVVGETPNLAARLQALAQPGTLVIAESTRRQIGALFEIAKPEERLSRSEQRTANKPKDHLTGKAPFRFESISLQRRVTCEPGRRRSRLDQPR